MEQTDMIKYLITTTEALAVPGVLLGMLFAWIYGRAGSIGRRILIISAAAGFIAACVMSWLKNNTKLINTGNVNLYIFSISIIAFLILVILDIGPIRKLLGEKSGLVLTIPAAVLTFLQILYSFPDILASPYTITLSGNTFFSTGFLIRFSGVLLGIILMIVLFFSAYLVVSKIKIGPAGALVKLALFVMALQQASKILQTLLSKRIIVSKQLFQVVKYTYNHQNMFTYGILLTVVFLPIVLWIRSFHVNEPYENPAQYRKIKARWRSIRRWSSALLAAMLITTLTITAVKSYANRPVELSPVEECEQRDDSLYISFDQVSDGHLHRFAYTTDDNITVRVIVIKKPGSSSYGIGLDACDICGETGYYERKGQVICNRCDVVMNVNTIGFKGGCNPKVIEYSVEGNYIIIPFSTLIEHKSDFK